CSALGNTGECPYDISGWNVKTSRRCSRHDFYSTSEHLRLRGKTHDSFNGQMGPVGETRVRLIRNEASRHESSCRTSSEPATIAVCLLPTRQKEFEDHCGTG